MCNLQEKRKHAEAQVAAHQSALDAAGRARAKLLQCKHGLMARCAVAANALLRLRAQHDAAPPAAPAAARLPSPAAAVPAASYAMIPRWHRASGLWPHRLAAARTLEMYRAIATVSYEEICAATSGHHGDAGVAVSVAERGSGASCFDAKATAYMAAAAQRACVPHDDIAFIHVAPYATSASGEALGFSVSCSSPECTASIFLMSTMIIMECFLLLGQQAALRAAIDAAARGSAAVALGATGAHPPGNREHRIHLVLDTGGRVASRHRSSRCLHFVARLTWASRMTCRALVCRARMHIARCGR
jgi:hypothetical protein